MRAPDLKERLAESENLMKEITQTWEEKLRKTEEVHKVRLPYVTVVTSYAELVRAGILIEL